MRPAEREVCVSLLLLALLQVASAGCPADAAALSADIEAGFEAHAAQDWTAFEKQVATVHQDIGCLTELADVPTATQLHHLLALYFAHHNDEDNARDALRGALSLDGAFTLPPEHLTAEPLLDKAYTSASKKGQGDTQELPQGSTWVVDGRPDSLRLPIERATLVQRHADQVDVSSWYVFGGQIPKELQPVVESDEPSGSSGGVGSRPLLFGGLAGLAVAAGGISWAELSWKATMEGSFTEDEARSRYQTAHAASIGSIGLGVAGAGLVAGAVVIGRW